MDRFGPFLEIGHTQDHGVPVRGEKISLNFLEEIL